MSREPADRPGRRRRDDETGMVTAETAVVLPVLLLVLVCAVAALTVVGAQLRCLDAAREGARAAARGETDAVVSELAGRVAPERAVTAVRAEGDRIRVTVSATLAPLGPIPVRTRVSAEAVAVREPGGAP